MADSLPVTGLLDVVGAILAEQGPLTEERLVADLAGRGVDLGADPVLALEEALDDGDGLVTMLADERWVWLPAVLAGRVFTHRLTGPEVEHDVLALTPDLSPIAALTDSEAYQRLADGSPVASLFLPFDADTLAERGVPLQVVDDDVLAL